MGRRDKNRGVLGFFVSRQHYWGLTPEEGALVVEVARGGSDAAGPDMLAVEYGKLGEADTYTDPREAVRVAAKIVMAWRNNVDTRLAQHIHIAFGDNWDGMFGPFESSNFADAMNWANEEWEKIPKCVECGDVFDPDHGYSLEWFDEYVFCSEWCVQKELDRISVMNTLSDLDEYGFEDHNEVWVNEYGHVIEDELDVNHWKHTYCGTAGELRSKFNEHGERIW